ncbi:MAG: 2-oxoisovalerate dehydrogenase [Chloroflexi bacterium]|nr:2-oxoisovalerate dehydrogenase [Chloroflexota bacterium]
MDTREITFVVKESDEGGYEAQALGHSIFTQGETWEELKAMVRDAVRCHFEEADAPRTIHLHLVRDEVLAL